MRAFTVDITLYTLWRGSRRTSTEIETLWSRAIFMAKGNTDAYVGLSCLIKWRVDFE